MPPSNPSPGQAILPYLGGLAAGIAGHFIFLWLLHYGVYALVLPGGAVGIGAGVFVRSKSPVRIVVCAALGLFLGALSEWRARPFIADSTAAYFFGHMNQLQPPTLFMLAIGTLAAGWLAAGKPRPKSPPE